ncbi:hypothetical protein BDV59DRAFT_694 [Aspergillus ambiguus]|uniref:uncharacterized protein n=1 Tax=Aspergillus ambiguus TaxID=176160 RepID=UPI003CCDA4DC
MVCPHPGIRGAFGGVTYNLGNAISSVAPTIETRLGDDMPLNNGDPNYGRIILILVGIMIGLLSLTLACMPTKNINLEWDLEDPNQPISGGEQPAKAIDQSCEVGQMPLGKKDQLGTEHIEVSSAQK